jgi:CheY-like chemotaxis protein
MENVDRLLADALEKSRRLSHDLSPPVLHQFGLVAALEWLVRHMFENFGLKVRMESNLGREIKDAPLRAFLFRAAQELLFNVIKHSGDNSADIYLFDSDEVVGLSVSDQGKGFDSAVLDSFTRKAGIGLVSLRERAGAIGGDLDIESVPGHGSRFTLTTPISLEVINETEKIARTSIASTSIFEKAGVLSSDSEIIRVMLVDDHKVMRQGLISIITDKPGIEVAGEAASGEEAVELAIRLIPDVIIMDISMPGMDGTEATRRIKAENPEIRVIGLSMYADESMSQKMREAGADGFVSKSESSSRILKAIYEVAGERYSPGLNKKND